MKRTINFLHVLNDMVKDGDLRSAIRDMLVGLADSIEIAEDSIRRQKETITEQNATVAGLRAENDKMRERSNLMAVPDARYNLDHEWVKKFALAVYKNDTTTRIPAIKLVRDLTNRGLADCKDYVDNMITRYKLDNGLDT